jgi:hypothetical protein
MKEWDKERESLDLRRDDVFAEEKLDSRIR